MKSGLGDRNNDLSGLYTADEMAVSMKSGLGDRNNGVPASWYGPPWICLNEVRSWRPEQLGGSRKEHHCRGVVSMKSGLGDRNNYS